MAGAAMGMAFRQLRGLFEHGSVVALEDGQLLARYEANRDEAAFEALVGRHGPMVLTTCRAVLRDEHDVEDAFQATFLVLARKAGSVRKDDSLGGWLHRVARRASVQASVEARRRRLKEAEAARARQDASRTEAEADRASWLHEEIDRLPEAHRLPVVLCDLEGLTYDQAARQLGWTTPTLRNRLARARQRLKDRLTRRGVSAPALAALPSVVPPTLARSTLSAATGGTPSAGASILTQILLRGMLMTRIKLASAASLAALALASAGLMAVEGGQPAQDPKATRDSKAEAAIKPGPAGKKPGETVEVRGLVVDPAGKPVAGATVRGVAFDGDTPSYPEATSGRDGRFVVLFPKPSKAILEVMGGEFGLFASAPGHGVGWLERVLRMDRPAERVVTLVEEGPPIEGRIIDLEGRPVAGASVRATAIYYSEKGEFPAWIARARNGAEGNLWQGLQQMSLDDNLKIEAKTDADGRFKLLGVGRDRIAELVVTGPGIATTQVHVFSRPEPEIRGKDRKMMGSLPFVVLSPKFQLAVMPGRRVEGVARDKDSGRPIAGLTITAAVFDENSRIPAPQIEEKTDAEGRYRLDGLPKAAAYRLFVESAKGLPYPNATLKATAKGSDLGPVGFDFTLKRGVMLRGRVTDKLTGKPVAGGSAIYYAFDDNPAIEAYPGFDESQEPYGTIDESGRFEIVALPGRGLVVVRDEIGRYGPASGFERIEGYDRQFKTFHTLPDEVYPEALNALAEVVDDPKAEPKPLELQLDPGRSVTIEVVDPDGQPLGGTKVKGLSELYRTAEFSQESDHFEVHALDPGNPRRVIIRHEARKLIGSVLLEGDAPPRVRVKLEPWGSVAGRIVDDEGKPRKGMFLSSPDGSQPKHPRTDDVLPLSDWNNGLRAGDDGRFLVEGLVPGLKYAANARDGLIEPFGDLFEGVTVGPGEIKDLGDLKVKPPKPKE